MREDRSAVDDVGFHLGEIVQGAPEFGSPDSVIHQHVAPRYLEQGPEETGVPNVVTAVLASYRGFDTLGEVTVVFTGGIGVIVLLRRRWRADRTRDHK